MDKLPWFGIGVLAGGVVGMFAFFPNMPPTAYICLWCGFAAAVVGHMIWEGGL